MFITVVQVFVNDPHKTGGNIKAGLLGSTNTLFGVSALLGNTGTYNTAMGVYAPVLCDEAPKLDFEVK